MSTATRKESSTASTNVIPFPRHRAADAASEPRAAFEVALNDLESRLKSAIEGVVADAYIKQLLGSAEAEDNPFDAVYISELVPDPIQLGDLQRIAAFANIEDLSHTLVFEDDED